MVGKDFILAGKSIFTCTNGKGSWYTYRVIRKEASERYPRPAYFVGLLTGPDNTKHYSRLGMINPDTGSVRLVTGTKLREDSTAVAVLRWALKLIWTGGKFPEGYDVHHEGYCGRCGRLLTVPESVQSGIGPECAKIMSAGLFALSEN